MEGDELLGVGARICCVFRKVARGNGYDRVNMLP